VNPIRLGLVGYGKIARDQHVPAIAEDARFTLAAIADPAASGPAENFASLEAMLAGSDIDAVVLSQPPAFRFEAAMRAIEAGKHVFLEKPPGTTMGEVRQLLHAAVAQGVTLYTAWHSRMAPGVRRLKAMLDETQIHRIDITWREDVRVWHPGQRWLWEQRGFGVFDPGINALSILTELLDDAPRLIEAELDIPENCAAPIAARLRLATARGAPIHADFDFREEGEERWTFAIDTSIGRLDLTAGGARLAQNGQAIELPANREYADLYAAFAGLIDRGACDVDPAPLALVADAWLAGTRRAAASFLP
jgi:predicted dehydrogenase